MPVSWMEASCQKDFGGYRAVCDGAQNGYASLFGYVSLFLVTHKGGKVRSVCVGLIFIIIFI